VSNRPYHHGDLRTTLLESAEVMLRERGIGALSLRELARAAGVSHNAPSRHFKDKPALIDALALSGFDRLNEALERSAAAYPGVRAGLMALATTYVGFAVDNPALLELMFAAKYNPEGSEQLKASVARLAAAILAPIADGQRAGTVIAGDPERIGLVVAAALHGIASYVANGALSPEATIVTLDDVVDHLLGGLSPR
jgi:AcrR family transcriptional regulator